MTNDIDIDLEQWAKECAEWQAIGEDMIRNGKRPSAFDVSEEHRRRKQQQHVLSGAEIEFELDENEPRILDRITNIEVSPLRVTKMAEIGEYRGHGVLMLNGSIASKGDIVFPGDVLTIAIPRKS